MMNKQTAVVEPSNLGEAKSTIGTLAEEKLF